MAYLIKLATPARRPIVVVAVALDRALGPTRFVCRVRIDDARTIRLDPVRLFAAKDYCGNHPGPCLLGGRRHRHYCYLEGADWVAYNDLINKVLDRLGIEADVGSSTCAVRKGRRRRVVYEQHFIQLGNGRAVADWERTGAPACYEDWCGHRGAPPSRYPDGTPGIYATSRAARRRGS
jgi:hypothetical protein